MFALPKRNMFSELIDSIRMRKILLLSVLVFSALSFSGCLDIAFKFYIHEDGTARMALDMGLDSSVIAMMHSLGKDSTTVTATAPSGKIFTLSQSEKDSVSEKIFGEISKKLHGDNSITGISINDSIYDNADHFILNIDLRSYTDLINIKKLVDDSSDTKSAPVKMGGDSIVIRTSGDTLQFTMIAPPIPDSLKAYYKSAAELRDHVKGKQSKSGKKAKVAAKSKKKSKTHTTELADSGNTLDSLTQSMNQLSNMMVGLFTFRYVLYAPQVLSCDTSGTLLPAEHAVVWKLDLANPYPGGDGGQRRTATVLLKPRGMTAPTR
jgi:hypothetical protein